MKTEQTVKGISVRQCLTLISLIMIPLALALIASQTLSAQLQPDLDLGDAPDQPYPTWLTSGGASHELGSGVYLGACVDAEPDGQPTAAADGDDTAIGSPVYGSCVRGTDEDGVTFLTTLRPDDVAEIAVVASAPCTLTAWIDFNANGEWEGGDETLYPGGQGLVTGINPLTFTVPIDIPEGDTYARFRCTTAGVVEPTGQAPDGEVEDYRVTISVERDLGDAPDPTYPTLLTSGGASHLFGSGVYLGYCVDSEADGQPTTGADGDDTSVGSSAYGFCVGGDDEDGVVFSGPLNPGSSTVISVTASAPCTLTAWIDFNANGEWEGGDETLFPGGQGIVTETNVLSFTVPTDIPEGDTYARFRCTTDGAVGPTGQASDGEVEDYRVWIGTPADFGDAPDPTYPTLQAQSGASHRLGSSIYLGTCVDAEMDGQPTAAANGDDTGVGGSSYGVCVGGDDEDGVTFLTTLRPDDVAEIAVVASAPCTLTAWIDFNANGEWEGGDETLYPGGQGLVTGINPLTFTVPIDIPEGDTYARFRCTTAGVVEPTGQAPDGEVEDYRVTISVERDLGDAPDPTYPTLLASGGASHLFGSGVYLGYCVDAEADGQPTTGADGDDMSVGSSAYGFCVGGDDEDGVVFSGPLNPGSLTGISVTASAPCTLTAWIDFNANGEWEGGDETLFPGGQGIVTETNILSFTVPTDIPEGDTYARFRCTTDGAVGPTGQASDGEVEDYRVWIGTPADFGDAPDPTYPTLQAQSGASHRLGSSIYLGTCVDAEMDGQPTAAANGDDTGVGGSSYGVCVGGDDEDGVTFLTTLRPDDVAEIAVVASAPCTLTAWIDFNADGDWDDSFEELFVEGWYLSAGPNFSSFDVPQDAVEGSTYARFRCASEGVWEPTGPAWDGEVEDYQVQIGLALDLGDAPDPTYPTLLASEGANHALGSGVLLGLCVDAEPDGQPSADADGDDVAIGSPVYGICVHDDDEDGVDFLTPLNRGGAAKVVVLASAPCMLSAWVDFNADGDWLDGGEAIFPGGQPLGPGANNLSFAVPADAVEGDTYARFRCTTAGVVEPTGYASDGEVEDYQVTIDSVWDFGDAPDPSYPTLLASSGARHMLVSGIYLGGCVDAEVDGQPAAAADGDDTNVGSPVYGVCAAGDDEDGVFFLTPLLPDQSADIEVIANASCTLSAWADFNGDGDWSDASEDLFPGGQPLVPGTNALSFTVPSGTAEGNIYARFRCTTDGVVPFDGPASNGEVEDYIVRVGQPLDFGDAPDPSYPTLLANEGASHVLGSGVYLGNCVDAEGDGQPTADAGGDDVNASTPAYGTCVGETDEDGVIFATPLTMTHTAEITVAVSAPCTLTAWIDGNHDGDWSDDGEALFPGGQPLVTGINALSFTVPAALPGEAYARFRCTTDGAVGPTGQASDGEVEDYRVMINANPVYLPLVIKGD